MKGVLPAGGARRVERDLRRPTRAGTKGCWGVCAGLRESVVSPHPSRPAGELPRLRSRRVPRRARD